MYIYVNFNIQHLQKQQHNQENGWRDNVAISLHQCILNQPVANQAAIHKRVDRVTVQLLDLGLRNETMQPQESRISPGLLIIFLAPPRWRLRQSDTLQRQLGRDGDELVKSFFAEDLVNAIAVSPDRWRNQHGIGRRMKLKVFVRMRKRIMRH